MPWREGRGLGRIAGGVPSKVRHVGSSTCVGGAGAAKHREAAQADCEGLAHAVHTKELAVPTGLL